MADPCGWRGLGITPTEPARDLFRHRCLVENGQRGIATQVVVQGTERTGINPLGARAELVFGEEGHDRGRHRNRGRAPLEADHSAHPRGHQGQKHTSSQKMRAGRELRGVAVIVWAAVSRTALSPPGVSLTFQGTIPSLTCRPVSIDYAREKLFFPAVLGMARSQAPLPDKLVDA